MKPSLEAFKEINGDLVRLFRRFCFLLQYYQCKSSFVFAPSDELYRDIFFVFLTTAKKLENGTTAHLREVIGDIRYNYYYGTAEWFWDEWEDLAADYEIRDRKLEDLKSLDVHDLKITTKFLNAWLICLVQEYFREEDWMKADKILSKIVK